MSRDEIKVMDGVKCILGIRVLRSFYSDKFEITKHKIYRLLEDYDKSDLFDIERYLERKGKVKFNNNTYIIVLQCLSKTIV